MYVEGYLKEGIRIDTLVPQNEPGYSANGYPTMTLESWQEAELASQFRSELILLWIVSYPMSTDMLPTQRIPGEEARRGVPQSRPGHQDRHLRPQLGQPAVRQGHTERP